MRQFPAYTLTSLRAESAELIQLLAIEKEVNDERDQDQGQG